MPPAPGPRARPDRATRVLDSFRARFGAAHELFACHAAFPAALTPELAYQLWAAFRADVHGRPLGVPWIAVADLLLSPLCAEIGEELYEMAPDVRAVLRRRLLDDPRLGLQRAGEVSELLFDVAAEGLHSEDSYERTLAQAQRLTALAHSAPERAAAVLAGMLAGIGADDHAGWMRMASLMEGLAEPLAGFPALAKLAPAMAAWGRGEVGALAAFVREHGAAVEVGGVQLTVPAPEPAQAAAEAPRRFRVAFAGGSERAESKKTLAWIMQEIGAAMARAGYDVLEGLASVEHIERCDAVIIVGGDGRVDDLILVARNHGKLLIPLPWTGGAAARLTSLWRERGRWLERGREPAPVLERLRTARLLNGGPRFRSDMPFFVDRVMAVLALHMPAMERAHDELVRGMKRFVNRYGHSDAQSQSLLAAYEAELAAAAPADQPDGPEDDRATIERIEATLPAMIHWLVDDFFRLSAVSGEQRGEAALSLLAPLLARHARHLARTEIGRAFDEGALHLDRWRLRWMLETGRVLSAEEYQRWVQGIAVRWAESYLGASAPEESDRIALAAASALQSAELSPRVEPLLPLLTHSSPEARVAGYLVCRTFGLPVLAETLDASLRLEQREVEERGATGPLWQLLGCYEVVPDIEHGAAARLAAAGLARMARLLARKESADADGSCGRAIRALLETRFRDAEALLELLDEAARRYERIRRTMPSDGIRTALMDALVQEIIEILKGVRLTPVELAVRFHEGDDGDRMVALTGSIVAEDPASFPLVLQAVEVPRSMHEQYWALRAASSMLQKLDRRSLEALRATLAHQLGGTAESKLTTDRLGVLEGVARELLKNIEDLLGRAPRRPLLDMVPIPAGRFWMGSAEGEAMSFAYERPRHEVEINGFEMARVPVTQRQYREVLGENPSTMQGDDWPVIDVSWIDALRFCNALSEREGLTPAYRIDGDEAEWDRTADGYRLPTEAEWEYAARGTDGRIYPWGNDLPSAQVCWDGDGNDLGTRNRFAPSPVGSYPGGASFFGLLDMSGNVWEWCWDWHAAYPAMKVTSRDPSGPSKGSFHSVRGGSWGNGDPADLRAASRDGVDPSTRADNIGFRCARGRVPPRQLDADVLAPGASGGVEAPAEPSPRRALDARLDGYARRYEEVQRTTPSSAERTSILEDLFAEVRKVTRNAGLQPEDLRRRFEAGGDGDRIVALAGVLARPHPASFEQVRQAVVTPRSSLEQLWALQIALRLVRRLDPRSQEALRHAVESGLEGAPVTPAQGDHDAAIRRVAGEILESVGEVLGEQRRRLLDMVPIPAGRFWMGSAEGEPMSDDDERPRHEVELSAFEIARVPVTQRQYQNVMGDNPSSRKGDEWPVTDVSWMDAVRFCNALSSREGLTPAYRIEGDDVAWDRAADGYRLPAEAEWEYAARGVDGRIYPWGNEPPSSQLCWDGEGSDLGRRKRRGPSPVGSYPSGASTLGLLDMAGNVWEWCWDRYGPYQKVTAAERKPTGLSEGDMRVLRGGSWFDVMPARARAAGRARLAPSRRGDDAGFRCARGPST